MIELYVIEKKCYYVDSRNQDNQVADGGCLPGIYLNADNAIKAARSTSNIYCEKLGYKVAISNLEHPARKNDCLFAERLIDGINELLLEIRVYKTCTID